MENMDEELYKKKRRLYHYLEDPSRPRRYRYYDTPDGEDLLKKLIYTTKYGFFWGFAYGGYITLAKYPAPKQRIWLLIDTFRRAFPFGLTPAVYTVTTYTATKIRGKDDVLNSNIGGAVAGFVFGAWYRNGTLTVLGTLLSAYFCGLKKQTVEMGIAFPAPDPPRMVDSSWSLRKLDFTLTEDIPGNWTSVPRPVPEPPPPPPPPPPPQGICAGFEGQ